MKILPLDTGIDNASNKMVLLIVGYLLLLLQLCWHLESILVHSVLIMQLLLRNHLHNCLQQGCLLPFPIERLGRENRKVTRHCFSVSIYCYCRMPETFSVEMIKCDQCL